MVIKAMFRARGETQRIDIADAIGRPAFRGIGVENMFSEAIADMRFCLSIRNQYAHCHWHKHNGKLCFVDLEEIAKPNTYIQDFLGLTFHYLDTALLNDQEAYFVYVGDCFLFLNDVAVRARMPTSPVRLKPRKVQRPPRALP